MQLPLIAAVIHGRLWCSAVEVVRDGGGSDTLPERGCWQGAGRLSCFNPALAHLAPRAGP